MTKSSKERKGKMTNYLSQDEPLYRLTYNSLERYVYTKHDLANTVIEMIGEAEYPLTLQLTVLGRRRRVNLHKQKSMTYVLANQLWTYDPLLGLLKWNKHGRHDGVGLNVCYKGMYYARTRIMFLLMTRRWPEFVDCIDGNRWNHKWENLREATVRQDSYNTSSNNPHGKGVWFDPHHNKAGDYRACLKLPSGVQQVIGWYKTAEKAAHAYKEYAECIQKEYALHLSRKGKR